MGDDKTDFDKESRAKRRGRARAVAILKGLLILLLFLALAALWSWTPLKDWINVATIIEWQESVKHYADAFFLVVGAYLLGSLFFFPVTILNVATVLTFGPIQGNLYGLAGWLASAAMGYGVGREIGEEIVKKVVRFWSHRVLEPADRHGFLTVLTAARIRFWDFFLASAIGRIPGVILL